MLGAFILVSALLVGATMKRRQNPLYQLSRYPRTSAFNYYLFNLTDDVDFFSSSNVNVRKSWFGIDDPETRAFLNMKKMEISNDGHYSSNQGEIRTLTAVEMDAVKNLVRSLPPSSPPDKPDDLLIVRLYQGHSVQIRLYNRNNKPAQIIAIQRIMQSQ